MRFRPKTAAAIPSPGGRIPFPWRRLLPLLVVLALTVPLVGLVVYMVEANKNERDAQADLEVIATFKARQIEAWLAERRGDAASLAASRGFIERLELLQDTGDAHARAMVLDRLASLQQTFAYDSIGVFDALGRPLVSVGVPAELSEALRAQVRLATGSGMVQMSNLYRDEAGKAHMHFIVPLGSKGLLDAVGVAVMHVDPGQFLYPLVGSWPTLSDSGETALLRREGDSAVFLNELRHRKGTAFAFKVPLSNAQAPAAAAVREGGAGTLRGVDYRGVPVRAAWQPVAGTDWKILAKMDLEEIRGPAITTALWAGGVMLLAAAGLAAIALMLFRQQHVARQLATRLQADSLLKQFYDLPFVGMATSAPDSQRWLNFNDRLCGIFGYTREELAQKTWPEMTHPEDLGKDLAEFDRVMRGESDGYSIEKRFLRKDGSTVYTQIDVKCVRTPEGSVDYFVCMIDDVSPQVAAQQKALRMVRLYRTLGECNAAVVRCADEQALFAEVCRAAVESGGLKMAWVGIVDPATRRVRPVASYGANLEYLDDIHVSIDADDPYGRGPTGTAVRENTPFWCQDFANDPRTAPWHARAAKYGWGASAGLPLTRNGVPVGALTLYGPEPGTLDEETRDLLLRIAADVSYGLENFEREAARKRAAQELRESESRFRGIVEQSIAGLYIAQDHKLVYVNPRLAQIFGYDDPAEPLGRDVLSFFAESERERIEGMILQRTEGKVPSVSYTATGLRKDGTPFDVGVHGGVATFRGRPAIIGLMQDITEKKRAEDQAARYLEQLQGSLMRTVEVATALSEMRDPYTAGHEKRVAAIAVAIATELGYDARRIEGLRIAGYLHDIGKITIPSEILSKPGKLSAAEYTLIKGHPQAGYEVLKNVDFPWPVADMVRQHHERVDGTGYPLGLKGEAILPEARILAVSDVIEAMASHRPYRPGMGIEKALAEVERGRGTAYDPQVADACLRLFREKGFVLPET